jgi:NAD(P)-dependent dehydrogenase (short-subunit alcohol dehydrogenase family)
MNMEYDPSKLFSLTGQVAVVTGAARGNGRAIAEGLAGAGVAVVLVDILETELNQTMKTILDRGQKALALPTDLRNPADLERVVEETIREYGKIDILVNCAGVSFSERSENYPEEKWIGTFEVNVTAAFRLSKLVARHMISRKAGSIINITSIGAVLGFPNNPAYQASKGALQQLTRALANDWAPYNIRVNNLCPGYFKTDMTRKSWSDPATHDRRAGRCMLRRWGSPEELVGPVIFLASNASGFMTGNDLFIDGGLTRTGILEGQ